MKIINIPLTCEQISLIPFIGFPLLLILSIITFSENYFPINAMGMFFGLLGGITTWSFKLMDWSNKNKLPKFRCRCDKA